MSTLENEQGSVNAESELAPARPLRRSTIKEELVALTGDAIDALILNQMIKYQAMSRQVQKFIEEERARFANSGKPLDIPSTHGWFYKKATELSIETMLGLSESNMRARLKKLIARGWVLERANPFHRWDKTKQYRVDIHKIAAELAPLGYSLDGWLIETIQNPQPVSAAPDARASDLENRTSKTKVGTSKTENGAFETEDRSGQNERAIPSRTTMPLQQVDTQQQQHAVEAAPVVGDANALLANGYDCEALGQMLIDCGFTPQSEARLIAKAAPALVSAWITDVQSKPSLKNPGGYLRKRIASGEMPTVPTKPPAPRRKQLTKAARREAYSAAYAAVWNELAPALREALEREGKERESYIETHCADALAAHIRQLKTDAADRTANAASD